MSSEARLREISDEITPSLERALQRCTVTSKIDQELQLRMSHCGLATAAMQLFLHEEYGVQTDRLLQTADLQSARLAMSERVLHIVLRDQDGVWIDPTYGQFLSHIGLTHRTAVDQNKIHLYPTPKIAVFTAVDAFADKFARHVQFADSVGVEPGEHKGATDGVYKGASLDEMNNFYRQLWSSECSEPHPPDDQLPYFVETVHCMVDTMREEAK